MLENFLKTSLRNLLRHKGYTGINVLGLTIGLAASIFILLWILDERSYDRFHTNSDRMYSVLVNYTHPDGTINTYGATPALLKPALNNVIPEVDVATQYSMPAELLLKNGEKAFTETGMYADSSFFAVFSFPLLKGSVQLPMQDVSSMAISEQLAVKLFGHTDVLGKSVTVGGAQEFNITAVFATVPLQSSLQFDFILPFENFVKENPWTQHWRSGGTRTTILLKTAASEKVANEKLATLIKTNCKECTSSAFLFPYVKARLYGEFENGVNVGGRIEQLQLFGGVAILILLMACINFTNLSTARSATRSREVGVRKALGSAQSGLLIQFISESILLSFAALLLALAVVQLLLPQFNQLTSKSIYIDLRDPLFIGIALLFTLGCGVVAGLYPALVLAKFNPIKALKGIAQQGPSGTLLRKTLVVAQFTSAVILVVGSVAAYKQITFIGKRNLGFDKENIIVVDQNEGIVKNYAAIKNEMKQLTSVAGIGFGGNNVFTIPITTTDPVWPGKPDNSSINFKIYRCDEDFIPTIGIKLIGGRNFSGDQDASNYIVNRKALEAMGLDLENAVGTELEMWNGKGKIIGVTEDFHNDNLKFAIEPLVMMFSANIGFHYFIKLHDQKPVNESLASVEAVFKKHNPEYPFKYTFLDEVFNNEYKTEQIIGKLSLSFTIIAIVISCLGLFGLASFMADRRTKELGIRKVMGASVMSLVTMLCRDFTVLVGISLCIGFPVASYLATEYLSGYAFHTEIHWSLYLLTGMAVVLIGLLSVSFQSIKAALSNPVDSLRSE